MKKIKNLILLMLISFSVGACANQIGATNMSPQEKETKISKIEFKVSKREDKGQKYFFLTNEKEVRSQIESIIGKETRYRIFIPGSIGTHDYIEDRMNVIIDEEGKVSRITYN